MYWNLEIVETVWFH